MSSREKKRRAAPGHARPHRPAGAVDDGATARVRSQTGSRGWIKGTWGRTDGNREAKFYSLTKSGERALAQQTERWRRLAGLVDKLLLEG